MRSLALALLVLCGALVPLAEASEATGARDLLVLTRPGATLEPPTGAVPLSVLDGFVVHDAAPALERQLRADPRVLRVEAAEEILPTSDPNLQLTRADPAPAAATGAPYTGRGVTVAVVDSGIDRAHPDLAGRVLTNVRLTGGRFVESAGDADGHGTHVAGIVAADGSSSSGKWRGVAPEASLVGIDISEKFTTASALLAYDWLYDNRERYDIRVVVNAWGRVGTDRVFDPDDAEIRAIDRLVDAGVVVLFSASNRGPGPGTLSLEAQDPRVVTVGAVSAAAEVLAYSSRGPVGTSGQPWVKPDVVAPGDTIVGLKSTQAAPDLNADSGPLHRMYSGTSQSVPHVAGIVALMIEANPALTPTQAQNALRESAIDLGPPGPDDASGFGLVDAHDAVRRALGLPNERGNVLVAGGVDRFEDEARLASPARPGGLGGLLGFASVPQATWTTTFPVKDGATSLAFDLEWGAPAGSVSVTLERNGATLGSWSRAEGEPGALVVRGRLDDPTPGMWTLRAQGGAPAALEVSSLVQVSVKAAPERGLDLDPRYRLPDAPPPSAATAAAGAALLGVPGVAVALPLGMAAGALGAALAWRPARRRIEREAVLEAYEEPGEAAWADDELFAVADATSGAFGPADERGPEFPAPPQRP